MLKASAQEMGLTEPTWSAASLFGSLLGQTAAALAPDVRALHCGGHTSRAEGPFRIWTRRHGWVETRLEPLIERVGDTERWHRLVGSRPLVSTKSRAGRLMAERIGRLEFRYEIAPDGGGLAFDHRRTAVRVGAWWLWIPRALGPRVTATVRPGLWISIEVRAPLLGRVLAYEGVVEEVGGDG